MNDAGRLRRSSRWPAAALGLALAVGPVWAGDEAVVLMYHRFGEDAHPATNVRLEQFESHLDHLASRGYTVVPLADVVAAVRGDGTLPERAVAITIDDAYRSVYREAYPRLEARGFPFTVFVATDLVDSGRPTYMTWEQMREMEAGGATFANHGGQHLSFVRRPGVASEIDRRVRVQSDIEHAERRLAAELHPLEGVLAYPFGDYDTSVAELVLELGYVAFGQHSGAIGPTSDPRALPRYFMAEEFAGTDDFALKVATRPLPVASVAPWSPVTSSQRPRLEVTLAATDARLDRLVCFAGGQGEAIVQWLEPGRRFAVVPRTELAPGRARVNCTAPTATGDRFHWFSHPWIVIR
ncbi:MAG TPA: polysaccharide deacetylase family protein [Candidatus Sulfomarinibacteraceae bacterium]|nr:polysaccharide deacetylase family protein [Candidatus Sulfomarinibacteraceae bacterium]